MGIPGILKEIGKGERVALSKLAVEHLERTRRPLRIAIDAAIWSFQNQAGQGGKNPALRTLFYRLLKLLALPIHPVFVYDGKNKPLQKRGKVVTAYQTNIPNEMSKKMVQMFRFAHHTAPGEAEAECAVLQRQGIVDVVMTQDVDAIMFGSKFTLRDWSAEGSRGNKSASHVNALRISEITQTTGLDPDGMVLVALLSGGDYDTDGLAGFGAGLACEVARAGFGSDLLELVRNEDEVGLREWRERLQFELETNESGYFRTKHKTLRIPNNFPDRRILSYYTNPAVSGDKTLSQLGAQWAKHWDQEIDVVALRQHTADVLDWRYRTGANKMVRALAPALFAHRLRQGSANDTLNCVDQIKERRQHFANDGIGELRVEIIPAKVVTLDLSAEEQNVEYATEVTDNPEDDASEEHELAASQTDGSGQMTSTETIPIKRKTPPWDPFRPEKIWIPETIVNFGARALVDEWHEKQSELLTNPKKFATRKCKIRSAQARLKDTSGNVRTLDTFFTKSKPIRDPPEPLESKTTKQLHTQNRTNPVPPQTPPKTSRQQDDGPKPVSMRDCFVASRSATASGLQDLKDINTKHGECAGAAITISSSPLAASHSVQKESGRIIPHESLETRLPTDADSQIPASVTQRKRSRKRIVQSPSPTATRPARPTIESFFRTRKTTPLTKKLLNSIAEPVLPIEPSIGLARRLAANKAFAVPRDSLPGTWKEVFDLNVISEIGSLPSERRKRISLVDLSHD